MTPILLDTNIVLRLAEERDPGHELVAEAVRRCLASGRTPCLTAQVLVEFWVVATRPRDVNGFGWEPREARMAIDGLMKRFAVLPDSAAVLPAWLQLVTDQDVRGKGAHDVRLAAVAGVHGVLEILTLNPDDFRGLPDLAPVHPAQLE